MNSILRFLGVVVFASGLLIPAHLGLSTVALAEAGVQATNVTGEWAFTVETDQGGGTPTITFKQDGEKLTGKYAGQLGNADLTGTVKGDAIHFTFTISGVSAYPPGRAVGFASISALSGDVHRHAIASLPTLSLLI